jgi:hypothetical protein
MRCIRKAKHSFGRRASLPLISGQRRLAAMEATQPFVSAGRTGLIWCIWQKLELRAKG